MNYEIKLTQFEGPFDLLLFFIERDELDIHEISVSEITDDFLEYIHQMNALNIELASEFILVAATLMRIKVKLLLPRPKLDEDGDVLDPRIQLIERLIEYKRFKQTIPVLLLLEDERFQQDRRGNFSIDLDRAGKIALPNEELEHLTLYQLLLTYSRIVRRNLEKGNEVSHTIVEHPYSIQKQKDEILSLLRINETVNFTFLSGQSKNKLQLVYNFLAILELLQQEILQIEVGLGFNNFWISSR